MQEMFLYQNTSPFSVLTNNIHTSGLIKENLLQILEECCEKENQPVLAGPLTQELPGP